MVPNVAKARPKADEEPKPTDPKPKTPPVTKAEVERRVTEIYGLLLEGKSRTTLLQFAVKWGVSVGRIDQLIGKANKVIKAEQSQKRKEIFVRHLAWRAKLYERAFDSKDWRAALAVLDSDAKLRDLFPDNDLKELQRHSILQDALIAGLKARVEAMASEHPPETTPSATAATTAGTGTVG